MRPKGFAAPEAHADNRTYAVVHNVLCGTEYSGRRVRISRNDQLDGRTFGNRSGPLHIQKSFTFFFIAYNAGIRTIDDDLRVICGQSESCPKSRHVIDINVGSPYDGNSLAGPIKSFVP